MKNIDVNNISPDEDGIYYCPKCYYGYIKPINRLKHIIKKHGEKYATNWFVKGFVNGAIKMWKELNAYAGVGFPKGFYNRQGEEARKQAIEIIKVVMKK